MCIKSLAMAKGEEYTHYSLYIMFNHGFIIPRKLYPITSILYQIMLTATPRLYVYILNPATDENP